MHPQSAQNFLTRASKVHERLRRELDPADTFRTPDVYDGELHSILCIVEQMVRNVENNALPDKSERTGDIAYIIRDRGPFDGGLSEMLHELEMVYRTL